MNLAAQLDDANSITPDVPLHKAMGHWATLCGISAPAQPSQRPATPHSLYGAPPQSMTVPQRAARRDARMVAEVAYLRAHGPLKTSEIADAFGISPEAMIKDLRLMESAGKIRKRAKVAPHKWEAMTAASPEYKEE